MKTYQSPASRTPAEAVEGVESAERTTNTLRKLVGALSKYADQHEKLHGQYTDAAAAYDDAATQLSALLPAWERLLSASQAMHDAASARSSDWPRRTINALLELRAALSEVRHD